MPTTDEPVFLDACCLLNFLGSGLAKEILGALPHRFAVSRYVADHEVLRISGAQAETLATPGAAVRPLVHAGLVEIVDLETEAELARFVDFAALLDDGEASLAALAVERGGTVATDDRKALSVLASFTSPVATLQTPELVFEWARRRKPAAQALRAALAAIRDHARFVPRRGAPNFDWWHAHLRP